MTPRPRTLVDVLRRHAAIQPDRRLYTFLPDGETEDGSLTFGQLDAAAHALARRLRQHASTGDRAMLLYPVGLDYLAAFLACLYAGIVAVPAYPMRAERRTGGRIRTMIEDCAPRLILTDASLTTGIVRGLEELGGIAGLDVLALDLRDPEIARSHDHTAADLPAIAPDAIAFLQYTSASVSQAKGVCVTHANLMANQAMIQTAMAHDADSTFVSWLPPYHDMGLIGNLLHPLYLGSSCAFMPPAAFVQKPSRWLAAISTYRAKTTGAPTFAYDLCVKRVTAEQQAALDLRSWTVAYCGAEMVDALVFERFAARYASNGFARRAFYPCYGLAEGTLLVSGTDTRRGPRLLDVDPDRVEEGVLETRPAGQGRTIVSCGTAPPGSAIAIVDPERLQRCADGTIGEIWVTGPHIASGYWRQPDATRDTFDARLDDQSTPYLRTGDLGGMQDGELYVTGRRKELIIHQGRNLYPTDIEQIVDTAAGTRIDACAAMAVPGDGTEDVAIVLEVGRHAAAIAADADAEALAEAIAWDVHRALDVWPTRIAIVKSGGIPRTSSGKRQRVRCGRQLTSGELPVIFDWRGGPTGPVHGDDVADDGQWLARLIARFSGLPVERIVSAGETADTWGLDSLRALELVHHIERRCDRHLPIATFFQPVTFDTILREIASGTDDASSEAAPLAQDVPVTRGQEALWFSQQIAPTSPAFHLTWALHCATSLDPDRLREATRAVIARHDVLRTVYATSDDGRLAGRVLPTGCVDYAFEQAPDETLRAWIEAEVRRPFALGEDLLVRVRHGRSDAGDLVAFAVHHLNADLWSCALLTEQILDRYAAGLPVERGRPFSRYAQHVARATAEGDGHRHYWRDRLAGVGDLDPVDVLTRTVARPPIREYEGASVRLTFDVETSRDLLARARALGVSRQILLLALHGIWLRALTDLDDFLVGCLSSGRSRAAFARMHGLLTNPFALRVRIGADATLHDVLEQTRAQVLDALEHEAYPFAEVVSDIRVHRALGRTPLFQNMFVYQQLPSSSPLAPCVLGATHAPFTYRDLTLRAVPLSTRAARYDLTMYAMEIEERLMCELVYNTALFSRAQIVEIGARFEALVRRVPSVSADVPVRAVETAC